MMRQEARSLAKVQHPHIVDVITAGKTRDRFNLPFIVMEWLDGATLRAVMNSAALSHEDVLNIATELLEALYHMHEGDPQKGRPSIIHRDIKPVGGAGLLAVLALRNVSAPPSTALAQTAPAVSVDPQSSVTRSVVTTEPGVASVPAQPTMTTATLHDRPTPASISTAFAEPSPSSPSRGGSNARAQVAAPGRSPAAPVEAVPPALGLGPPAPAAPSAAPAAEPRPSVPHPVPAPLDHVRGI